MWKKIKDVTYINKASIKSNSNITNIVYLDIGNITEGVIKEYAYYSINEAPSRAKRIVKENDIIFSTVRPKLLHYGLLNNIPDNLIVSTGFVVLTCKAEILPGYLYAFLRLPSTINKLQIIAENSTSAYPSIKPMDIGNLCIKIPPVHQQKKIVKILSSLDNKIDLNNKIIDNFQKISQELYKRWFIDFEFPNEEGKPYKSSGGKMIDSEFGLIPDGWEVKNATELLKFEKGTEPGSKNYLSKSTSNSIRFIRVGDMLERNLTIFVNKEFVKKELVKKNNIIVSFDGTIGRVSYGISGMHSSGIRKVIPTEPYKSLITEGYILSYMTSEKTQEIIAQHATGTTILHAGSSINYLKINFNEKLIKKYNYVNSPVYNKLLQLKEEINVLIDIRAILLPKLLAGGIRLDNILEEVKYG